MPSFMWSVAVCVFLLWFVSRCIAWAVIHFLQKYLKVKATIGKVGFFSFKKVKLHLKEASVEADCIWLSSQLVNKEVTKPLAICVSDVRFQAESRSHDPTRGVSLANTRDEDSVRTTSQENAISRIVTFAQYVGLCIKNIDVILTGVIHEGLIHSKTQNVSVTCNLQQTSIDVMVEVSAATCKVLQSVQETFAQSCIAEFSISKTITVQLNRTDLILPEFVDICVTEPKIRISEDLIWKIRAIGQSTSFQNQEQTARQATSSNNSSTQKIAKYFPKVLALKIDGTSVCLCNGDETRTLNFSVKSFKTDLNNSSTSLTEIQGTCRLLLEELELTSCQSSLANIKKLNIQTECDVGDIHFKTHLNSAHAHYNLPVITHWMNLLGKLTEAKTKPPQQVGQISEEKKSPFVKSLLEKSFHLDADVLDVSVGANMSNCDPFVLGVCHIKIEGTTKSSQNEEEALFPQIPIQDLQFSLGVSSVYCKLTPDMQVKTGDLSNICHIWSTVLYIESFKTELLLNVSNPGVNISMDSVQLEWSSSVLDIVQHTIKSVLREIKPRSNDAVKQDTTPLEIWKNLSVAAQFKSINFYACVDPLACLMIRLDSFFGNHGNQGSHLSLDGAKLVQLVQSTKSHPIVQSSQLHDCAGHLKTIYITLKKEVENKKFDIRFQEEVYLVWNTRLHMCLYSIVQNVLEIKTALPVSPSSDTIPVSHPTSDSPQIIVTVRANLMIAAQLSKQHRISFSTPEIISKVQLPDVMVEVDQCSIAFDQHDVFQIQGAEIFSMHHDEGLKLEREGFELALSTNRAWGISFNIFSVIFPYKYNFAACFEQIVNINKWLKVVHKRVKPPFTVDSPLPPDLRIKSKTVSVQLCDDPFEVKLRDNYVLLSDEQNESRKRERALDRKIGELKRTHGLLPASKIEELYASLKKKNADIYLQRSRQLYAHSPMRSKLFTWSMEDLEIIALADTGLHGKGNVVKHMREIDHDSPYPEGGLEFTTLWCRVINTSVKTWEIHMRDYPQAMLEVQGLNVWGRLIGAEQEGASRAKRTNIVEVGAPWGDSRVERSMPALKFYHDFSADVQSWTMAYGACWEPCMAMFNLSMDLINKPSVDPSTPMPFWDKIRLLFHGRLTMAAAQMSWLYHASLNPYNTTEMMDWTWTDLILDWTNAKWVLKGNLDVTARTASKYDDARILYLPNLRFCIKLEWVCLGDPNDHHSVMPCAPDKIPEFSLEEHDSFRAFRSQNLNMSLSFETKPTALSETEGPSCVFFASTLRWMDKIKMCMANVTRPTKRGIFFLNTKPRKPQLSRHYKNVNVSMSLHQFNVWCWLSAARQHGVEMNGGSFSLVSGFHLTLKPVEDGLDLVHRPQADWSIQKLSLDLKTAKVSLCSASSGEEQLNVSIVGQPVKKNYFLSVDSVSYERDNNANVVIQAEGEEQTTPDQERFTHKVTVDELKGAWTKCNRNTVFGLYDGYQKATALKRNLSAEALKGFKVENSQTPMTTALKRNLSAEALKGFKVENSQTPMKPRSLSMNVSTPGNTGSAAVATPSPLSRLQSGHAHSMLQKLVQETDSKFVAFSEEPSGGNVEQLLGLAACQSKDVLQNNWLVELRNSQVMLKGGETPGHVIVSAAKAQIWSCQHQPVWKDQELKSKTTWVGEVDCMQYYATVDPSPDTADDTFTWLAKENIEVPEEVTVEGTPEMVGSGVSVGGVVSSTVGTTGKAESSSIQLQRIISRCKCQFFYASYGEVDADTCTEVPLPSTEESDMLKKMEGVDAFTLLHHDLNICTNSLQYAVILDIVNNLLLYVDPKKKEAQEKLDRMRFKLQLSSVEDQKTPILQRQDNVRKLVLELRRLERELYILQRSVEDSQCLDEASTLAENQEIIQEVEKQIADYKEQLNAANEELTIMISCFTQSQLRTVAQLKASKATQAVVLRHNEVCFKHAQWRLTETDGQLGLADLVLRNFLYHKVSNSDDSGQHQLEVGWVKVTNLLPNSIYKDVLVPRDPLGKGHLDRQVALRILAKEKAPVGGIPIKEHFEVNVVPLNIQLTYQFYRTMMNYFFPESKDANEEQGEDSDDSKSRKKSMKRTSHAILLNTADDIDKMKERAASNKTFLYIKIPEVQLRVSYKGEKEKNIEDVHDFSLVLPTLEYHNQTWTWLDLLMEMKTDSKRVLLSQAIKQKLHMKSRQDEPTPKEVQEEEDKAKMLMGAKLLAGEKPSSKKNLFGKSTK